MFNHDKLTTDKTYMAGEGLIFVNGFHFKHLNSFSPSSNEAQ